MRRRVTLCAGALALGRFGLLSFALWATAAAAGAEGSVGGGDCVADDETLCLNEDRFRVRVRWQTSNDVVGDGQAVRLTNDTGYFWFFSENNVEVVVKVLDGCRIGEGAFWVFIGGLTDVHVEVEVEDVLAGETKLYLNQAGRLFRPVTDTAAFATCNVRQSAG